MLLHESLRQLLKIEVLKAEDTVVVRVEPLQSLDGLVVFEQLADGVMVRKEVHYGLVSLRLEATVHEVRQLHVVLVALLAA